MQPFSYAPEDVQAAFAAVVVDEWVRSGVTDAVVSPGSRSTPLLVALAETAEAGRLHLHIVLDERSAGFFALGLGLASGVPAPVVTTSGTAAAELHAPVIEAHHSGVPMLAVTADRPAELHDCAAPQTVRQEGLFADAVRWAFSPGVPSAAGAGAWRSIASRAIAEARGGVRQPGPVHLNLAFREPLIGRAESYLNAPGEPGAGAGAAASLLARGRAGGAPWHDVARAIAPPAPREVVEMVVRVAAEGRGRGLVVAGSGAGDPEAVRQLARATCWPVLASPTSGCRFEGAICAADALLRAPALRDWRPDVVVRLGHPWASRVLGEWLAGLDCLQVLVDPWGVWAAPDRLVDRVVPCGPEAFCREVAQAAGLSLDVKRSNGAQQLPSGDPSPEGGQPPEGGWAEQWRQAELAAQGAIDAVLSNKRGLSEPAIARALVSFLPVGSTLVVASSMPIREGEWWGGPREGLRVLSNRGANGIDGTLSTALGVAAAVTGPVAFRHGGPRVVALVGDLAFAYDVSALLWARERELSLDIVVLDNGGGGIFSFLPQASSQPAARFERLWGTPHGTDLVALARGYGVEANVLEDLEGLHKALSVPPKRGVRVWVAKGTRHDNLTLHQRLWSEIEKAIGRALGTGAGVA